MAWPFGRREKAERRNIENPETPLTAEQLLAWLKESWITEAGVAVTPDAAMRNPAFGAAVRFIASTIASLPLQAFKRTKDGEVQTQGRLAALFQEQINDEMSSFEWRENSVVDMLTNRRWLTYIERADNGAPINLFPLAPSFTTVKRVNGRMLYEYREPGARLKTYDAADVIDICWISRDHKLSSVTPFDINRGAVGLAIAMQNYGASFFKNGAVPPLQLIGNFQTEGAMDRASHDMTAAVRRASERGSPVLPVPLHHELKAVGVDPKDGQLVEAQRFCVEEIARGFGLPPVFLQDLTHGTFTNTEQQDLHLVKHLLRQLVRKFEAEFNAKLFPRTLQGRKREFVRFNLDGLLQGDFKTRMEGYLKAVNAGVRSPDECAVLEGLPAQGGLASERHIQGATRPINAPPQPPTSANDGGDDNDAEEDSDDDQDKDESDED